MPTSFVLQFNGRTSVDRAISVQLSSESSLYANLESSVIVASKTSSHKNTETKQRTWVAGTNSPFLISKQLLIALFKMTFNLLVTKKINHWKTTFKGSFITNIWQCQIIPKYLLTHTKYRYTVELFIKNLSFENLENPASKWRDQMRSQSSLWTTHS